MSKENIEFTGALGDTISGVLERPDGEVRAWAVFAHGFSIGKDFKPLRTISRTLLDDGIALLRFDFTGLGDSGGDFADTNFTTNVADILAACEYLRAHCQPPTIMIGHSFGGTAMLKAAHSVPECVAVATIGSPSDTHHILHQFGDELEEIVEEGEAKVLLAGRPFTIKEQFVTDVSSHDILAELPNLNRALIIMHSPQDNVVNIGNATQLYVNAKHPKSFVSLDGADHLLLSNARDAEYVARVLAAWSDRYVREAQEDMQEAGQV